MLSSSLSIRQPLIHTSNISATQKSAASTPKVSETVLQGVLHYVAQFGEKREKLIDLRRELAALEKKRCSMSIRVPLDQRTNVKELSAKIAEIKDNLITLAGKKAEQEKIIAALESKLETLEATLEVRTSTLGRVKAEKEDEEKKGDLLQRELNEKLINVRSRKKFQSDLKAAEIDIYSNEKSLSEQKMRENESVLKRFLQKKTPLIQDALARRPIEELDKSMKKVNKLLHLDLSLFMGCGRKQDNKQRIVIFTNYIAALNLMEEQRNEIWKPPGIGAAAIAAITTAVTPQFHRKNALSDPKMVVIIMAEALFATAILVFISRAVKTDRLHKKLHRLKIERLIPEQQKHTTESDTIGGGVSKFGGLRSLGTTKQILFHMVCTPDYQTRYRDKLVDIFMNVVSPKIIHKILTELQSEIERNLLHWLDAKNRLADETEEAKDESGYNAIIFDRLFVLNDEKIKDTAIKALMAFKQQERSAAGSQKAFLKEAIIFLEKDQASLMKSLQSLIREFCRETFLAVANDPVLRKHVQAIASEQSKQASLEQAIQQVKDRPSDQIVAYEDRLQLDFNKSRIESIQRKYNNVKNKNDEYRAKYHDIDMQYKQAQESHAALTVKMNELEDVLKETRIFLRKEKTMLDGKQAQARAPAEALDKEISQVSARINQMVDEEDKQVKDVLNNRSEIGKLVEELIEPKALQHVVNTHFRQTPEQLEEHKRSYGYASNYLSPEALLESLVHAHQAFRIYDAAPVTSGRKSYSRLYAGSGKTIAEGMSSHAAKLISSGTVYDMNEKTGRITHVHPFIPRLSQSLNALLQNHGMVE